MKLSELSRYYLINFGSIIILWTFLLLIDIDVINITFFILGFIWHFALLAPGIKEKILTHKNRFSFLTIAIKTNYYLQMFIPVEKIPYGPSIVRAISPFIFSSILFVVGASGNLLFPLMGSACFEIIYLFTHRKIKIKEHKDDPEIPPVIPSEESVHE